MRAVSRKQQKGERMFYAISALLLALGAPPTSHRFVVANAYTSTAAAHASMDEAMQTTGLAEAPAVGLRIVYADFMATTPQPVGLHAQEFTGSAKGGRVSSPWDFYTQARGRAKGMVTTSEGTVVVWWID